MERIEREAAAADVLAMEACRRICCDRHDDGDGGDERDGGLDARFST